MEREMEKLTSTVIIVFMSKIQKKKWQKKRKKARKSQANHTEYTFNFKKVTQSS